jgi:hypothetical protein
MVDNAAEPDRREGFGSAPGFAHLVHVGWEVQPAIAGFCGFLVISFLLGPTLRAQQTVDELRDLARNPVADAIKVPFVDSINYDAGPYDRTSNSLQLQPVIPLQISKNWLLVPRVVATALAYEPDVTRKNGGTTGLGDIVATFFFTPFHARKLIWGLGPSLLIPTATDAKLGAGKWDVGPSVAVLAEPDWGSVGVVVQNIWSLPGHSNRASVNQIQIETSVSYNLPQGWYLVTAPTINGDWTQATGERWLVPFGGGAGRTFDIRNQAVDSNVALYYNAIRPSRQFFPRWELSLQFTLLYPKEKKPKPN